ncbi:MAG: peptidoglycan-binding domain-containing protein [Patescibacteria group bacterium]
MNSGSTWTIHPGTATTSYLSVSNSTNTSGNISCTTGCTDGGGNSGWTFEIIRIISSGSRAKRVVVNVPLVTPIQPKIYNFGPTNLKIGSVGEAVKELQNFLNSQLNLLLVVDGKFGPKTLAAVKLYQTTHNLVADGIVGPLTKGAMGGV